MADYQSYVTDLQKQFLTAIQKVGEVQAKLYRGSSRHAGDSRESASRLPPR